MGTMVLPGIYITVRDEGLISVGGISVGVVGVVGFADGGNANEVVILSSYTEAKAKFGISQEDIDAAKLAVENAKKELDAATESNRNTRQTALDDVKGALKKKEQDRYKSDLLDTLELIFNNGASSVYAVKTANKQSASYEKALAVLENQIVNIVTIAGKDATDNDILGQLKGHLKKTATIQRERIAIVGCGQDSDLDKVAAVKDNVVEDDGRVIYTAPGLAREDQAKLGTYMAKSGSYTAAALTGLIASLPVRTSPTNKTLVFAGKLSVEYNFGQLEKLVGENVVCIERREGYRVVKGVTTSTNSAWRQITTRRIVDKAIYGVRAACNPYIGKLNNPRVRSAMKATIDGFLTSMLEEESLTHYTLEVSATRQQEIQGIAAVTILIQPTFSIDYVQVTMNLG
jgi:Phage tail sheath protein subtilisin-like domain/Phage tail sheath C-terminal domain